MPVRQRGNPCAAAKILCVNITDTVAAMLLRGLLGAVAGFFVGLYYGPRLHLGLHDSASLPVGILIGVVVGAILGAVTALGDSRTINEGKFPGGPVL